MQSKDEVPKMNKETDLGKLEDVKVAFGKTAFAPKIIYCDNDDSKMEKAVIEMPVLEGINVKLNVFRCPKCGEEVLGLDEAKKLDRALVLSRIMSEKSFGFKRRLSYDGDNFIFRLPSELTKDRKCKEIEIIPLESREAIIRW